MAKAPIVMISSYPPRLCGVATFCDYGVSIQEVIHLADRALYQAKARGRNQAVMAAAHSN